MKKIKASSTGVYIIEGLILKLLGQEFKLNYGCLRDADPTRLVAIVRQQDFKSDETSVGYVWDFKPDKDSNIRGTVMLGLNGERKGSYRPIHTSDIIGWCYLDEPIDKYEGNDYDMQWHKSYCRQLTEASAELLKKLSIQNH